MLDTFRHWTMNEKFWKSWLERSLYNVYIRNRSLMRRKNVIEKFPERWAMCKHWCAIHYRHKNRSLRTCRLGCRALHEFENGIRSITPREHMQNEKCVWMKFCRLCKFLILSKIMLQLITTYHCYVLQVSSVLVALDDCFHRMMQWAIAAQKKLGDVETLVYIGCPTHFWPG